MPHNLWGLNSPTRDQTQALAVKVLSPNHWTGNSLAYLFLFFYLQPTCTFQSVSFVKLYSWVLLVYSDSLCLLIYAVY